MDYIAEQGLAAHWKYKEGSSDGSDELDKFVHWVRDVLDTPRPDAATEFVKDFQLNLYQDEIYVFTPNGELKTLPNGASCIDFAFEIDRKSTRLNSSHVDISYAVFCLKNITYN